MTKNTYFIPIISSRESLSQCEAFAISHYQWNSLITPKTWGYMGFCPSDGFYIRLISKERNPLRLQTHHYDPVYTDSAMEAFLQPHPADPRYLNFEINANGALLAMIGNGREKRSRFTDEEITLIHPTAFLTSDGWQADLTVPLPLLNHYFPTLCFAPGSVLRGNFYKIQENKTPQEHYGSFAPIHSDKPDFHRPEDFAELIIKS